MFIHNFVKKRNGEIQLENQQEKVKMDFFNNSKNLLTRDFEIFMKDVNSVFGDLVKFIPLSYPFIGGNYFIKDKKDSVKGTIIRNIFVDKNIHNITSSQIFSVDKHLLQIWGNMNIEEKTNLLEKTFYSSSFINLLGIGDNMVRSETGKQNLKLTTHLHQHISHNENVKNGCSIITKSIVLVDEATGKKKEIPLKNKKIIYLMKPYKDSFDYFFRINMKSKQSNFAYFLIEENGKLFFEWHTISKSKKILIQSNIPIKSYHGFIDYAEMDIFFQNYEDTFLQNPDLAYVQTHKEDSSIFVQIQTETTPITFILWSDGTVEENYNFIEKHKLNKFVKGKEIISQEFQATAEWNEVKNYVINRKSEGSLEFEFLPLPNKHLFVTQIDILAKCLRREITKDMYEDMLEFRPHAIALMHIFFSKEYKDGIREYYGYTILPSLKEQRVYLFKIDENGNILPLLNKGEFLLIENTNSGRTQMPFLFEENSMKIVYLPYTEKHKNRKLIEQDLLNGKTRQLMEVSEKDEHIFDFLMKKFKEQRGINKSIYLHNFYEESSKLKQNIQENFAIIFNTSTNGFMLLNANNISSYERGKTNILSAFAIDKKYLKAKHFFGGVVSFILKEKEKSAYIMLSVFDEKGNEKYVKKLCSINLSHLLELNAMRINAIIENLRKDFDKEDIENIVMGKLVSNLFIPSIGDNFKVNKHSLKNQLLTEKMFIPLSSRFVQKQGEQFIWFSRAGTLPSITLFKSVDGEIIRNRKQFVCSFGTSGNVYPEDLRKTPLKYNLSKYPIILQTEFFNSILNKKRRLKSGYNSLLKHI